MTKHYTLTETTNRTQILSTLDARDIAMVGGAISKLPTRLTVRFATVDELGRKIGNDVPAQALAKGARFIHRNTKQPLTYHYLIVQNVHRFSNPQGLWITVFAKEEHGPTLVEVTLKRTDSIELFDFANR